MGSFLSGASIKRDSWKTVGRKNAVLGIATVSNARVGWKSAGGFKVKYWRNVKHIRQAF